MTEMIGARPSVGIALDGGFSTRVRFDDPSHVVVMVGNLDLVSRAAAIQACTAADHRHVVADMSGVDFMDCAGYGALISARTALERRGGSLALINARGGPLRLLSLIRESENSSDPAWNDVRAPPSAGETAPMSVGGLPAEDIT